jgi:ferritin
MMTKEEIKMTNKEINEELESAYQYVQSAIGTLEMLREDQDFAGTKAIEDKLRTLQKEIDNLELK